MFGCYDNKEFENCSVGESLSWQQAIACQVPQQSYQFAPITDYQAQKGRQVWGNLIMIFTSPYRWQRAVRRSEFPGEAGIKAEHLEWLKITPGAG